MKKITFKWKFQDDGLGRRLQASCPKGQGPELMEMSGGVMYPVYSSKPAPEWVQEALKKALPILRDWKPKGHLGREGYWVGEDVQSSPEVEVEM